MFIFGRKKFLTNGAGDPARWFLRLNLCLIILVVGGAIFSVVRIVMATTPDPGHPWTSVGDGIFAVTGPSTTRTYTFPDAAATVLTTNAAVTVAQGGTGGAPAAAYQILVSSSTTAAAWKTITACEGANQGMTYSQAANSLGCNTFTSSPHALLDGSVDSDTFATTASRGMVLVGNSTPQWGGLTIRPANNVLYSDGTSPGWGTITNAMLGGSIDLTAKVTGVLPAANGGTGVANFNVAGPTVARTYAFPNADATVLTTASAVTIGQGGTSGAATGDDTYLMSYGTTTGAWQGFSDCQGAGKALGFTVGYGDGFSCINVSGGAHALLDGSSVSDSLATTVSRGMLIVGNSTPKWSGLTVGGANTVLTTNGTDPSWATVANAMIATGTIDLTAKVTGLLPVSNGGTGVNSLTLNNVILGNNTSAVTFVAPGTSGNILTANGTAWTSVAPTGTYLNQRTILNGTTSYTPTAGTKTAVIEMWGGGGAGGGCQNVGGGAGGGGGSGGYAMYVFTSVGAGPFTVAVGAAGTGASGAVGGNGGITTFNTGATTITANGGTGGTYTASSGTAHGMTGGAGGVASSNGTVNGAGAPGGNGIVFATSMETGGEGGATALGGGGLPAQVNGAGSSASGTAAIAATGGGGGGAACGTNTAGTGGNGGTGLMRILEYR